MSLERDRGSNHTEHSVVNHIVEGWSQGLGTRAVTPDPWSQQAGLQTAETQPRWRGWTEGPQRGGSGGWMERIPHRAGACGHGPARPSPEGGGPGRADQPSPVCAEPGGRGTTGSAALRSVSGAWQCQSCGPMGGLHSGHGYGPLEPG